MLANHIAVAHPASLALLAQGNRFVGSIDCFFKGQPSVDLVDNFAVSSIFVNEILQGNLSVALTLPLVKDRLLLEASRSSRRHLLEALARAQL